MHPAWAPPLGANRVCPPPPIPTFPSQLGEADGSDGAAASPRGSYRPQGRWAECAEHGPIKTLPEADLTCFTPAKSSDLEGEAELEPRNLEELLLEVRGGTPGPHRGHRCVLEPLAGGRTERGSAPRGAQLLALRLPLRQADTYPGSAVEGSESSELFPDDETERELDLPDTTGPSLDEPCSEHGTPEASRFLLPRGERGKGPPLLAGEDFFLWAAAKTAAGGSGLGAALCHPAWIVLPPKPPQTSPAGADFV